MHVKLYIFVCGCLFNQETLSLGNVIMGMTWWQFVVRRFDGGWGGCLLFIS